MRLRTLLTLLVGLALATAGCLGGSDDAGEDSGAGDDAGAGNDTADGTDPDADDQDAGMGDGTGGDDNATAEPDPVPPVSLSVSAVGAYPVNPAFDPATLDAPAGAEVTLTFTNNDEVPLVGHDWVLEGVDGAQTDVIAPGESTEVVFTAPLEPGDYAYYCSVGDHRERGMEGTFTVTG